VGSATTQTIDPADYYLLVILESFDCIVEQAYVLL
jgi:hypothetical protein